MSDSADEIPEHERRIISGVWQPRTVEPKDKISPFQPAPKGRFVQCFVVKDPVSQAFCLFLQLTTHLSNITNKGKFILAAREISHVSRTEFSMWNELDDLSEDSDFLVGKVMSNLSRTEYVLYDCRQCGTTEIKNSCWRPHRGIRPGSKRVLEVHYIMTLGKPQQFHCVIHTVTVPNATGDHRVGPIRAPDLSRTSTSGIVLAPEDPDQHSGRSKYYQSRSEPTIDKSASCSWSGHSQPKLEETLQQSSKSDSDMLSTSGWKYGDHSWKEESGKIDGEEAPLILKTKAYERDESGKRFYAEFKGRDRVQGSWRNFQMVIGNQSERENDETLLQFGEVSPELFFMDYAYPLTAFEAFGICLTMLD